MSAGIALVTGASAGLGAEFARQLAARGRGLLLVARREERLVVREGIEAVERGAPIWISGRIYRWLDPVAQSVWLRPLLRRLAPGR